MNKSKNNNLLHKLLFAVIIVCSLHSYSQNTFISGMNNMKWEKVMPGVWKASFGTSGLNPLEYSNPPKTASILELGDTPFPFAKASTFYQLTPERAIIRMPLDPLEKIYGLGLEFEGVNRRGGVYTLKVDHYGGVKGYTHAPVPFYVSSKGYGVLINTSKRLKIHVGVGNRKDSKIPDPIDRTTGENWSAQPLSDAIEASIHGDGLEIYVFTGNTSLEVVQRYNLFCGGGTLPPKWGLGFWHRMHTTSTADDVLKEISDFKKYNFPIDVLGLEPGWQSFAYPCSFDWDSTRFPNPEKFVKTLSDDGIKVNLWENPYVAPSSTMFKDIKPYTGSHTVWLGEVPDYTIPEAQKILLNHHQKNHLDIGISGYKFDEVDGYDSWLWPDHATFPSGNDAVEIRQLYGQMIQKIFGDHFKKQNKRTYGLVRASYIGASSSPFVIYSDYYGHKGYVTALVNSSISGLQWTPEIRSAKSAEEWVRRFQTVCFSPMMLLNAWASKTKPWSFPEVTNIVRDNIKLRKDLLPYLYTAFYKYHQKGIPPFRAMVLESGFDAKELIIGGKLDGETNPYEEQKRMEVTDQYMMGSYILVAPVFTGETARKVVLPKGNWYDFYTGAFVGNGKTITIKTKLEQIPLFVKDGGIIPMVSSKKLKNTDKTSLEVRHYGTKENTFELYNDDGKTFNYENGDYSLLELKVSKKNNGKLQGQSKFVNNSKYSYGKVNWRWMSNETQNRQ
ncbi:glycoside hydrolase family 31 protein [Polaribacter batillariae]|uniref:Glycoside hydrolase family 31 protein n=1 Tax=Polaribacter batillariae TaxID=2808900 RepID=A0ABX7SVM3_9FLAO|nr:TIM-barrel domain-containing protein [Polaribacter batillariae]QTD37581.1 glycoside hydrolase family 31 protein [Polaribacter batillariae]